MRLFLFLLLCTPLSANAPRIPIIIKEVRPNGTVLATPILPLHLILTGDTNGLQKGEAFQCEIVKEETRKEPNGRVVEDRYLRCSDDRKFHVQTVVFEVSN